MTLLRQGFLTVSYTVSSHCLRFPIFGAANRARISGNFARTCALGVEFHGFLLRKRFQVRKPDVSSWFPAWFTNWRGSP